jgi:hypothetical protein
MTTPKRIAVCGDSLLLTIAADSLRANPGFHVTRIVPRLPDALAQLAGYDVALVEYNTDCENDRFILSLLQARPDLPVIGLDANRSVLTVLSSRQQAAADVNDLINLAGPSQRAAEATRHPLVGRSCLLLPLDWRRRAPAGDHVCPADEALFLGQGAGRDRCRSPAGDADPD